MYAKETEAAAANQKAAIETEEVEEEAPAPKKKKPVFKRPERPSYVFISNNKNEFIV